MKLINEHLAVQARLVSPDDNGYLLQAGEVGNWCGPLLLPDRRRNKLLAELKGILGEFVGREDIEEAVIFRGLLRPPGGEGGTELLKQRHIRQARFDIVVLVRTPTLQAARALQDDPGYKELTEVLEAASRHVYRIAARNVARINDVDHRPNHPFLFNYFYADDPDILLDVWKYTAGWFQKYTSLPNSTLLQPLDGELTTYGIINHASWPNLRTFLPGLVLRPGFRSFVLANFKANGIAAQPIIYRRL